MNDALWEKRLELRPLRRRKRAPFVASAPLRGVCHTCGARDVERTVPENGYLPICAACL